MAMKYTVASVWHNSKNNKNQKKGEVERQLNV